MNSSITRLFLHNIIGSLLQRAKSARPPQWCRPCVDHRNGIMDRDS